MHRRDLPWRAPTRTPWGVLVSEVMLQQTPVVRVLPRWLEWMEKWPAPADLANAPTADVLRAWDRLGYPRRALRLQECARTIVERHNGEVPDDETALLALPGIGEYTAAAVISFAFGRRATVLDTNIRRVLARVVDGVALPPPHLSSAERSRARALVPHTDADAAVWAAGVMELGALVCVARNPHCEQCPVVNLCAWNQAGLPPDALASQRRTQGWHGTDRQVRGAVMGLLRRPPEVSQRGPITLTLAEITATLPDSGVHTDEHQLSRCMTGLVHDGLAVVESGGYRLP